MHHMTFHTFFFLLAYMGINVFAAGMSIVYYWFVNGKPADAVTTDLADIRSAWSMSTAGVRTWALEIIPFNLLLKISPRS
jgi:hypothetical protein